ncbi:MAG: DsbA family protein [Bifidobacteriaceae bacterium]|jgi:hypothetical protein|nr:DsbA family protein [Bifidobacteriaceae bacterium]
MATNKKTKPKRPYRQLKARRNKIIIFSLVGAAVLIEGIILLVQFFGPKDGVSSFEMGKASDFVTNTNMTEGDAAAEHHFVEYTDLFCPYCAKFALAVQDNQAAFEAEYLQPKKIYFELRITDLLSNSVENPVNSHNAALTAYCTAEQGKFWDFYRAFLTQIKTEFYDQGIGNAHGAPHIPDQALEYFTSIAQQSGSDLNQLNECLSSDRPAVQLANANAMAAQETTGGLPYFIFGDYKTSGFNSDWETVKQMFAAGGAK